MNAKNVVVTLVIIALLATAGLAWRQHLELEKLRGAALASNDSDALKKKLADLQRANRDLQDQLAAAKSGPREDGEDAPDAPERPGPANNRRDGGPRQGRGQQFAAMRELMNKPEVQALMATAEKGAIDARYAALFKKLNLSPEQADKLKALLVERQNTVQDVSAAAREQGIDRRSDPDAFKKMVADAQKAVDDNIKSVIGDEGLSQLNNFEQTMPQRNLVNVLQQRLTNADAPLSSAQADQLVQILAAASPGSANGSQNGNQAFGGRGDFGGMGRIGAIAGGGFGGGFGGGGGGLVGPGSVPITDAALNQASGVLSAAQLSTLQQLQQQQQIAQQLQQVYRNALQPATGTTGTTGTTGSGATGGGGRRRGGG